MRHQDACPICGRKTNSWVRCAMRRQNICQRHCEGCEWFSGKMLWNCWYKEPDERQSFGSRTVNDMRRRIETVNLKIALREQSDT